ncbi:MAG: hypothetical protein C0436_05170 [Alphaproteobacteria bacterium]|nr:hypothetical protein [Alphaproteobacteria bacterium]
MQKTGPMDILHIAAGGTIAAEPYASTPEYVSVETNAHVVQALQAAAGDRVRVGAADFSLKDSKDITPEDIERMAHLIAQAEQPFVVITHGTDAMPQNARALKALMQRDYPEVLAAKTIVFTGAMEPLHHGARSDGFANLRDAVTVAMHNAKAGVSIVMHGMVLNPERAVKDFDRKAIIER